MSCFFPHYLLYLLSFVCIFCGCSEKPRGIPVGMPFPQLSVLNLAGSRVTLHASGASRFKLVSIRTLGCRYCASDFVELEKIARYFPKEDVAVTVIGSATERQAMVNFIRKRSISFPVYVDEGTEVMRKTQALFLPVAYLVDAKGVVRYRAQGALSLKEIKTVLTPLL